MQKEYLSFKQKQKKLREIKLQEDHEFNEQLIVKRFDPFSRSENEFIDKIGTVIFKIDESIENCKVVKFLSEAENQAKWRMQRFWKKYIGNTYEKWSS